MIRVPRFDEIKNTSVFCVDDCIATYAEKRRLIYESMYLDELEINIKKVGNNYSLDFRDRMVENLGMFGGVIIKDISEGTYMIKELENALVEGNTVMLEMKGLHCPWDWRYQNLNFGNHTFLLTDWNKGRDIFSGVDPYYGIEEVQLTKQQLMKGYIKSSVLTEGSVKEKELIEAFFERLAGIVSFNERASDFSRCFDYEIILNEKEYLICHEVFDDYHIENCELSLNLLQCIYSRRRFAILLDFLEKKEGFRDLSKNGVAIYIKIAKQWEKIRNLVIKSMISGKDYSNIVKALVYELCILEDEGIEALIKKGNFSTAL